MDKKLAEYKKSGKFARYVQKYNIYKDDDYDVIKDAWTIGQLLDDIYHNNSYSKFPSSYGNNNDSILDFCGDSKLEILELEIFNILDY